MVNLLKFTQIVQLINTLKIGVKQSDKLLVSSIDLIVKIIQCNLDLVTSNLVTTCHLVTILKRPFFNLLHKLIQLSDVMIFSSSFCGDQKCH